MAKKRKSASRGSGKTNLIKRPESKSVKLEVIKEPKSEIEKQRTIGSSLFRFVTSWVEKSMQVQNPEVITIRDYRSMLDDAGILYPLWIIKLPIIRSKWTYNNPNEDIRKFVQANLNRIWAKLIKDMLTSFEFGFAAFEKRFEEMGGKYWYKSFVDLEPDYINIKITEDGSYDGFVQKFPGKTGQKDQPAEIEVPVWKSLIVTHDKRFGNHYGRSRLRSAYRYWNIDKNAYNFHAIAMQDYSVPTAVGRAPTGQTPVGKNQETNEVLMRWNLDLIQEVAESIHSKSALSFPAGDEWSLDLLAEKKSVHWDFDKDHKALDLMKGKAIFVPDEILVGGKGGSYAKAEVHSRWLSEMIESIEADLAGEYIMPYIIEPLIMLNFFDGRIKPPTGSFSFAPLNERDREFLQEIFKKTFVDTDRYQLNFKELADQFGLPLEEQKQFQGESLIARIAKDMKTTGRLTELDRKVLAVEIRRAFNSGIKKAKTESGFEEYVSLSQSDLVLLDGELKTMLERLRSLPNMENLNSVAEDFFNASKSFAKKLGEDTALKVIRHTV